MFVTAGVVGMSGYVVVILTLVAPEPERLQRILAYLDRQIAENSTSAITGRGAKNRPAKHHTIVLTDRIRRTKRCAEHTCGWVFWELEDPQPPVELDAGAVVRRVHRIIRGRNGAAGHLTTVVGCSSTTAGHCQGDRGR
ncbi:MULTISPECIES: hypothetical protein [Streptomyces]|uniref:Transposase n=1 Tax=Streptomyces flaveolus TaxID=67297 RepID=A0ABV3AME0_9ACTN|nr:MULTISPECIES: hypothetical protein [Streptomyces]